MRPTLRTGPMPIKPGLNTLPVEPMRTTQLRDFVTDLLSNHTDFAFEITILGLIRLFQATGLQSADWPPTWWRHVSWGRNVDFNVIALRHIWIDTKDTPIHAYERDVVSSILLKLILSTPLMVSSLTASRSPARTAMVSPAPDFILSSMLSYAQGKFVTEGRSTRFYNTSIRHIVPAHNSVTASMSWM